MSRPFFLVRWGLLLVLAATGVVLRAQPPEVNPLRAKATFHFDRMALSHFAGFLSQNYKIPVTLDQAGLKRAGVTANTSFAAAIDGIPLDEALTRVLGPLKLAHYEFNGVVLITDLPAHAPARLRPVIVNPPMRRVVRNPQVDPLGPLRPQLQVELQFVRKICAPSKQQMQAITRDLEKCLADAAKRSGPTSCDLLPPKLADCVADHLSKEDAARYRSEVIKRDAQESEACVYTLVALVDPDLSLSEPQRKALVAALIPVWKPVWSQMIEINVRWGTRRVPPLPDEVILPLLDADQVRAWKRLPKNLETRQAFDAQRIGAIGTPNPQPDDE